MSVLLLVDDDPMLLQSVRLMFLDEEGIEVLTAESAKAAVAILSQRPVDVIVSDQMMPQVSGIDFLRYVGEHYPAIQRILLSGDQTRNTAVSAINKAEVYRFLVKPANASDIVSTVKLAIEIKELRATNEELTRKVIAQNALLEKSNIELEKTVAERTAQLIKAVDSLKKQNATLKEQRTSVLELVIALVGQYDREKGRTARLVWESIRFYSERTGVPLSDELPYAAMLKVFVDPESAAGDDTFLRLLSSVEGFNSVAALIMGAQETYNGRGPMRSKGEAIPMEARLLRIASDFHTHDPKNLKLSRDFIVDQEYKIYDPSISRAFLRCIHEDLEKAASVAVEVDRLLPGMVICQDVLLTNGSIVLPSGVSLTITMISQLKKLGKLIKEKIRIYADLKGHFADRAEPGL